VDWLSPENIAVWIYLVLYSGMIAMHYASMAQPWF